MPAGVAFDGSPWVTAASSVGLVAASFGLVVAGGIVIAQRAVDGMMGPPPPGMQQPDEAQRRRSMPLEKSAGDRAPTEMPPPAESVDRLNE